MATVTVSTTPVALNDGGAERVWLGNTGDKNRVRITCGARLDRWLDPGSSMDLRPEGVAVVAQTASGSTTVAVTTIGLAPMPGGGGGSTDGADRYLSNLINPALSRDYLGLGAAATMSVGTGAGSVAAGDDTRITGALQAAANLEDVADPAAARDALELGGAATLEVGTGAGTVAAGDDSRLTGPRPPTAHAASHSDGGSDEVTLAQAQVTGLVAVLAAKADLIGGKVPASQLPSVAINDVHAVSSQAEMLALAAVEGDVAVRSDNSLTYLLVGSDPSVLANWVQMTTAASVTSVAGKTGVVLLDTSDITGLASALTGKADTNLGNVTPATGRAALGLGDSATRNVGSTAGTVAAGNDARLADARAPLAGSVTMASLAAGLADLLAQDPAFTSRFAPLTETPDEITWVSGVFLNHDASQVTPYGTFRDRPVQVWCVFPGHSTQAEIGNTWWLGSAYTPSSYTGDLAIAVPMCADGQTVATDISAQITQIANALAAQSRTCWIRLGWEMNLPQWAWKVTDANLATWRSRYSTYYDIFKSIMGATKARVGFNPNVGANQSGLTGSIMQAWVDGKVDWGGPDLYDCWEPFTSDSNVATQRTRDQGMDWWASTCRTKGVQLAVPEWGVSSGTQWAGHQGNDNPRYITEMHDWMVDNSDIMAFDAYFNESASYVASDIWRPSGTASNPLSGARYVELFSVP
jgi:hypothetical protein